MRTLQFLTSLLMLLLSLATELKANPLKIELVTNASHIQPGQPFEVALHLRHPRHYHTYWKHPGVVGVPTQIEWQLPQGWKADPIQWPAPKMVNMFTIRAQGYHGDVLLPIRITPPKTVSETSVTLQGRASWMCCYKECNPGTTVLSLTIPVSNEPATLDSQWDPLFRQAHANMPSPLTGWTAQATIHSQTKDITLTLKPDSANLEHARKIREVTFFAGDELVNPNMEQVLETHADGSFTLQLKVSEYFSGKLPTHLTGLVMTPKKWQPAGHTHASIQVPLNRASR